MGEADIKQCFDTIDQDWMGRRLAERLDDSALLRWIRQWLKAGVLATNGTVRHPVTGTLQGGTVSSVLAKVCLHYVLEVWEKGVKRHCRGEACLLRYADDCVCAFADQTDAERFPRVLGQRLEKFGLERSAAKTRIMPFRRHRLAGQTSFAFLGCEFRWGKARKGQEPLKRRTARQKLRASLQRFTAWCKANRHLRLPVLVQRLNAKRRGYYNYYGVHGNAASLLECFNKARRIVLQWRNWRSQRHSYTWPGYTAVLERFKVARPRIVGRPKTRRAALTTSADLRKRVFLKSPVRENRTPGAVRGRSGNWPSYRDGGSNLRDRVECSTRKSEDREASWRSNILQVHSLHDRKRPSHGQVDTAHACPIACHCERQSHPGRPAFGDDLRWQARDMGQEEQSTLRARAASLRVSLV